MSISPPNRGQCAYCWSRFVLSRDFLVLMKVSVRKMFPSRMLLCAIQLALALALERMFLLHLTDATFLFTLCAPAQRCVWVVCVCVRVCDCVCVCLSVAILPPQVKRRPKSDTKSLNELFCCKKDSRAVFLRPFWSASVQLYVYTFMCIPYACVYC